MTTMDDDDGNQVMAIADMAFGQVNLKEIIVNYMRPSKLGKKLFKKQLIYRIQKL